MWNAHAGQFLRRGGGFGDREGGAAVGPQFQAVAMVVEMPCPRGDLEKNLKVAGY